MSLPDVSEFASLESPDSFRAMAARPEAEGAGAFWWMPLVAGCSSYLTASLDQYVETGHGRVDVEEWGAAMLGVLEAARTGRNAATQEFMHRKVGIRVTLFETIGDRFGGPDEVCGDLIRDITETGFTLGEADALMAALKDAGAAALREGGTVFLARFMVLQGIKTALRQAARVRGLLRDPHIIADLDAWFRVLGIEAPKG